VIVFLIIVLIIIIIIILWWYLIESDLEGSRKNLCINTKVNKPDRGLQAINDACLDMMQVAFFFFLLLLLLLLLTFNLFSFIKEVEVFFFSRVKVWFQ
jgi:hypothetical protein